MQQHDEVPGCSAGGIWLIPSPPCLLHPVLWQKAAFSSALDDSEETPPPHPCVVVMIRTTPPFFLGHIAQLLYWLVTERKHTTMNWGLFVSCSMAPPLVLNICASLVFQDTGIPNETLSSFGWLLHHHKHACEELSDCLGSKPFKVNLFFFFSHFKAYICSIGKENHTYLTFFSIRRAPLLSHFSKLLRAGEEPGLFSPCPTSTTSRW